MSIESLIEKVRLSGLNIDINEETLINEGILKRTGEIDEKRLEAFIKQKQFVNEMLDSGIPVTIHHTEVIKNDKKPFMECVFDKYDKNAIYINTKAYEKNTPYALRNRKQFVCWKWVWKENEKDQSKSKWTKVPINAKTGYGAKTSDPSTWSTFEEACKAVDKYKCDGIGINLGKGLMGIDLDNILDENGNMKEMHKDIIEKIGSYTELSVTHTGVHILVFGDIPKIGAKRIDSLGLEIYSEGRFFVVSGEMLPEMFYVIQKKADSQPRIDEIYDKYWASYQPLSLNPQEPRRVQQKLDLKYVEGEIGSQRLNDEQIIEKASRSYEKRRLNGYFEKEIEKLQENASLPSEKKNEKIRAYKNALVSNQFDNLFQGYYEKFYDTQSSADMGFIGMIAFYTDSPSQVDRIFRKSGLIRDKWDEKRGDTTYGHKTIEYVFSNITKRYDPSKNNEKE
ncbi:MAG: hypothetical protein FWE36_08195 [Erysipelotrichales bacterium]|nr:hypothetical protein [Erysipelotrichales bacterium]